MSQVLNPNNKMAGSNNSNEPRHIGVVIDDLLHSDSPFAKGYREFLASTEGAPDSGGKVVDSTGPHKNTMICVDVKTVLIIDRILQLGKKYPGILMMDDEDHLLFEEFHKRENESKRNHLFFPGLYINGTIRLDDNHVRLNFKEIPFGSDFNIDAYAIAVMMEVRKALSEAKSLIEGKVITK